MVSPSVGARELTRRPIAEPSEIGNLARLRAGPISRAALDIAISVAVFVLVLLLSGVVRL